MRCINNSLTLVANSLGDVPVQRYCVRGCVSSAKKHNCFFFISPIELKSGSFKCSDYWSSFLVLNNMVGAVSHSFYLFWYMCCIILYLTRFAQVDETFKFQFSISAKLSSAKNLDSTMFEMFSCVIIMRFWFIAPCFQ